MTRRTLYLPVLIVAATVVLACAAALLAVSEKAEATFPGKNGRIAYARGGAPDSREIYTMKAGGGGRVQLTNNTTEDGEASYSPNSKRIAYAGHDGKDWEIYTMKATGGGRVQLTDNTTNEAEPSYSPDGKKIVYSGEDGPKGDWEIYTIKVGGGGRFNVTDNNTDDYGPSWGRRP
jgi:TolB protein